jgi:NAD-dependent deacetylase
MLSRNVIQILRQTRTQDYRICLLTGAGISADSGIRTFRGDDGYWTIGSDAYTPQEMATMHMFQKNPKQCWQWYLERFLNCRNASPNDGHFALVELEKHLGNRFTLVTQNIDGLHLKAGSSLSRCHQIHGSITHMRCSLECTNELFTLPVNNILENLKLDFEVIYHLLKCPYCGALSRPHVLWFDECYNEIHYRADSALKAAQQSDLLIIAGTTLLTSLPSVITDYFLKTYKPIIGIDTAEGNVSDAAKKSYRGDFVQAPTSIALAAIVKELI